MSTLSVNIIPAVFTNTLSSGDNVPVNFGGTSVSTTFQNLGSSSVSVELNGLSTATFLLLASDSISFTDLPLKSATLITASGATSTIQIIVGLLQ